MNRLKQWLRSWLGIQHLSDYIALTRKELGLTEGIAVTNAKYKLANESESKPGHITVTHEELQKIKKGYDKSN